MAKVKHTLSFLMPCIHSGKFGRVLQEFLVAELGMSLWGRALA
jgi:hypothetical protein